MQLSAFILAINAQDLGVFINELMHGNVISQSSLDAMKNWFDKQKDYDDDVQIKNGYGLEYFENKYGTAYGHTGSMDGFESTMNDYPDRDITIIFLFNHFYGTYDAYLKAKEFTDSLEKANIATIEGHLRISGLINRLKSVLNSILIKQSKKMEQ